ncbi:Ig-like domain repeat protein [Methanobrevibacter sp.]
MNYKGLILMLFILFLSMSMVSANEIGDNITSINGESPVEIVDNIGGVNEDNNLNDLNVLQASSQEAIQSDEDDVIVVNDWDELQYYCAQTDKDYTLKLKENTNFYPNNSTDINQQIKIKNNVRIIGSESSWIGDSSPEPLRLKFLAMVVEDDLRVGLTVENVTFKWIETGGGNLKDGMFIKIGGKRDSVFKNCQFNFIRDRIGHACIIHLNKGTAIFDNCSIINCTNGYGCLSVYNKEGYETHMIISNCYFENNYATTEPGCINNCGKLTVYNTTFVKNKSFWWAGAIHTHSRANSTIYDSIFIDNVAGWNGGALYTYSYLQVYNSVFIGNNCTTDNGGGAIGACAYGSDPHIYIENCLFEDNANNCWYPDSQSEGTGRGGAISIMDWGSLEVRDTTFIANAAAQGTAICAIDANSYGSPDVWIINNSFINHTRVGDVLKITTKNKIIEVHDNYYLGNSIEFSNLTLTKLREGREQATLQVTASLSHSNWYDEDILDKTLYDVYINNKYVKTVNSTTFSVDFGDFDICDIYVIPTISNCKSNEVTIVSTREYIFVSKSNGDDTNNGISRQTPVNTIKRALELAGTCQNIILLDGDYSESNIQVDYDVTVKGEGNATLTNATSFISNSNFTLKNLRINNLNSDIFINQIKNSLSISHCIFTNNDGVLVNNGGFASISNSILLNNSQIITGNLNNINVDYNWWGTSQPDLSINKFITLNITSNVDSLENNHKANVNVNFYTNENQIYYNLPGIDLNILTINGIASENTIKSNSQVTYTLTAFEDGTLTVNYNDFTTNKSFEFLKSNPTLSLTTSDVMVGDNLVIKVNLPSDCEGNLTANVGNISETNSVSSPVFTFSDLKAGTYDITVIYSGDKKYVSKNLTSSVNVDKYESATLLNISDVNVGEDVILTITTTESSTGNITLTINNSTQTITLNNSKASYTIKNIKRGDYRITAVYGGDEKYLESQTSKFLEVDNLNATINIATQNIVYGETEIIKITLNDDATGEVTVTVDGLTNTSKIINGKAELKFSNLNAGFKNITVFYSGDDTYFNLTESSNFTIDKADLTFNISSRDIRIGQVAEITIQVAPRTSGTFTIGSDVLTIPMFGLVTYGIADLEIGDYTYTAVYNGNNYKTVSNSTSFKVSEYPIPQVPNNGLNPQNTHKTEYETSANGNVAFIIPFNETLIGDLVIDSLGNVYLTSDNGIYCFNQTGRLWYWSSNTFEGNLSGISISRDVIIAPKSGDTLYFINQTSGERYGGSNIYQGSSLFAPVVDSNANLYILSEYQYSSEDYKLVFIPYSLWENGGDPTLVTMGNTKPLCAPTLNDDIIVVISDNRFRLINAKTLETISLKSGNFQAVRPVIGEGNIVYSILSDSIVAYNGNGVQVWKTKVTGGVGNILVLDNEQGLYHINAKGIIYKYDIVDGTQSKFSNLKVTSGILIDANNNLYFGSNNVFYALDSESNVLWKSDLGSKIIGNPVMDKNGLIYVPTEKSVVALTYDQLSDSDLKVSVDDIVEGEKATITITWNNQTTGSVSYTVNGEDITVDAEDAKVTKIISGLTNGYYDISVSYSGDMRFKQNTVTKTFVVRSTDDVANNIQFDGNSTFSFSLTDAQGNLIVSVGGKTYSNDLVNGQASITIDKLSPGDWDAVVTYSGDRQFSKANRTFSISVAKFNVLLNESVSTENMISRISVTLPGDAKGNLTLSVGTRKYAENVINGSAVIIVDDLAEGNYTAVLAYSGDNNYESVSKSLSINPTRIPVILDDANVVVKSGPQPKVSIKLNNDATGSFTVHVDDNDYQCDISEELTISGLEPGNYSGVLRYGGDFRYAPASKTISFEVPKIIIDLNETVLSEDVSTTISVSLPMDASGDLTVSVGTNNYVEKIRNGKAVVIIDDLGEGNYTAVISYSNDIKYESTSKIVELIHSRISVELDLDVVSPCETPSVSVKLDNRASGSLTVNVNGNEYSAELIDGSAVVNVTGLNPGNYSAVVTYTGDFRFTQAVKTVNLEVPKIALDLNELTFISPIAEGILVEVSLPTDAGGDISVQINTMNYAGGLINGFTSININNLDPGNYTASMTYSGDGKYEAGVDSFDFEVAKIILQFNDSNLIVSKISGGIIVNASLPGDADGEIIVSVNGDNFTETLTGGASSVKVTDLAAGNWQATVTYTGNDKYVSVSKIITFAVDMREISFDNTTLSVISPSHNPAVNVKFDEDVTGNITVTLDNKVFTKELVDGCASVELDDLSPGSYSANVVYSGDDNYGATEKMVNLEVPRLSIALDNVVVKSNVSVPVVSVVLPSDAGGNIMVNVSGNVYTAKVIDGNASVEIAGLAPGSYTAEVIYSGDKNYSDANKTVNIVVPKIVVNLNNDNCRWNASQIAVDLKDATGTLTVEIGDKSFTEKLADGSAVVDISGLEPGSYDVKIMYSGDDSYSGAKKVITLEIPKIRVAFDENSLIVDSGNVSVALPGDASGNLTVVVSGRSLTKQLIDGKATVNVDVLAPGTYNATVIYSGDDKYSSVSKSCIVEISKFDCELSVDAEDIDVGESVHVNVKVTSKATGNVTVTIDNKDYVAVIADGIACLQVSGLDEGTYNVSVKYMGDSNFNGAVNSTQFKVSKVNIPINNETISVPEDNSTEYSISLPSDATGTLTVSVDGKTYTETLKNGKATVNIPELDEGSHNITVTYSGDGKYASVSKSSVVVIGPVNSTGDDNSTSGNGTVQPVPDDAFSIPDSGNEFSISLPGDAAGTLTVSVDGKEYSQDLVDGRATVIIPELGEGSHNVTVSYSGDGKYASVSRSSVVVIGPVNSTGDDNSTSGNGTAQPVPDDAFNIPASGNEYSISLPSDATGTLTVTVDGKSYSQNLINGKASVTIPELGEGSHNITVTYSGDGKYAPTSKSSVVVKEHVPVIKLTASNLSMLYASGKYFKVRLTSDGKALTNKKVRITIGGKTYTRTTDKNGYASMKITLAPKTYSVKATYGNLKITKKVIVKSIISAKNINAKKSAKSIKIKVTLKKVNKKYLKNKKVTLKFNKKTFKAKTNKKGVATFTIKNSVFKKLKVNKKYTYQVIYAKNKVKKSIKFKK